MERRISIDDKNLKDLEGLSVKKCWRLLHEAENENIPEQIKNEESDGLTYILFSNGEVLCFAPESERFTIRYKSISQNEIPHDALLVSSNTYWSKRIDQEIIEVGFLNGNNLHSNPYGLRLNLINSKRIDIMYISESDYTFDALIIK